MICYSCNRLVGVQWVKVCPLCGNEQIEAQNIAMRRSIDDGFALLEKEGVTVETMIDDIASAEKSK